MKNKILAISIILVLLISVLSIAVPILPISASPTADYEDAIAKGADRLVALQSSMDYGWDWVVTDQTMHSGNPSATNLYGVTALGLLDAYQLTGNTSYFNAAEDLADFITYGNASQGDFYNGLYHDFGHGASWYWWGYSFDYRFLVRFSEISGNTTYKDYAVDAWNWVTEPPSTYYGDGNQTAMYNVMYSHYGSHGGAAWASGDFALAALACGDTAWAENMSAVIQSNLTKIDGTDGDRYIGWGKALETFQEVDPATYSTEISTMVGNLSDSQGPAGNFSSGVQDNAYAIMGLVAVGETDMAENAADWLVANQGYDTIEGGWKAPTGKEYSEITSEAAQALYAVIQGVGPVGLDHGSDGTIDVRTMTIQQAIDAAYSGDTIIVSEGTYIENVNVNKAVTLKAASRPVIDGNQTGPCITIAVDGVTVESFELTNGTYGIASWGTDDSVISNNVIHDNLNIPGYAGIGIMFWSDSDDFDNNTISGNEIYNNDRQGIYIGGTTASYISEGNTISGNTIYNNGLNTTGMGPDASMYGIQLSFADDNKIVGNEIYGHDDWFPYPDFDFAQGIYLFDSNNNFVTNNYLHDNNYGVGLWRPTRAAGNNHINYNNIASNTGYGVRTFDDPPAVDARFNWWGHPGGPTHLSNPGGAGDAISDNVDYSPWLGFVVGTSPMTWHVNPTGAPGAIQEATDEASPGDTIIVHAGTYAGAIVDKNVTVIGGQGGASIITSGVPYKVGSALYTAFRLDATADGAEIRNFTISCNSSESFYFAIFSRNADNVSVDSLTVNDAVQGITNWGGSNWRITNNVLNNTEAAGGGGIAIFLGVYPPTYTVCSGNLIQNNTITATATAPDYTCPGIGLGVDLRWGAYDYLTGNEDMSNNQILNNSITAPGALNGVGIEMGVIGLGGNTTRIATTLGIIHENLISDNTMEGADMGIYFYTVTNLTIQQNEIRNCNEGIHIKDGSDDNTIKYNNILGNVIGLNMTACAQVYNNTIEGGRAGIWLGPGPYSISTTIKENTIRDFVKAGIVNRGSTDFTIEENIISTTIHDEAPNGIDIGIYTSISGTIKDNEISGCSWKDFTGDYDTAWSGSGILVIESGDSLEIAKNTVYDCDVGMDIESDSMNITCNDVHSNIYGFVFWNANPVVHHNNIYNNTLYGAYRTPLGYLTGTLDAEYNWWGDPSGPYHNVTNTGGFGDRVSDGVDYDPWLDGPIPGDVAIISITPSRNMTCEGTKIDIYVTAKNEGNPTVTFDVTLYYDSIAIGTQTVTDLAPGANTTLTFSWDTTGVTPCINYTISAEASTLPCEVETANNIFTDGKVKINIFGDINGDGKVNMKDVSIAARAFGSYPGHPRWNPAVDMNNDSKVNIRDISSIARNFGKTHP